MNLSIKCWFQITISHKDNNPAIKKSVYRNERKSSLEPIQLNTKDKLQKRCHCKHQLLSALQEISLTQTLVQRSNNYSQRFSISCQCICEVLYNSRVSMICELFVPQVTTLPYSKVSAPSLAINTLTQPPRNTPSCRRTD